MDLAVVITQIANVGFPAVIAILFWRHISTTEKAELKVLTQISDALRNCHPPRERGSTGIPEARF
jgi:hypothetical protein